MPVSSKVFIISSARCSKPLIFLFNLLSTVIKTTVFPRLKKRNMVSQPKENMLLNIGTYFTDFQNNKIFLILGLKLSLKQYVSIFS